jgi:hypothetical protein
MTSASAVSGALRQAGFNPVGSGSRRAGLKVRTSYKRVRVTADLDSDRAAADLAVDARQALVGAGYEVQSTEEANAFYVVGRGA